MALSTSVIRRSLLETLEELAYREFEGNDVVLARVSFHGDSVRLNAGSHEREFVMSQKWLESRNYAKIIDAFRDEVRCLAAETRRRNGLTVGVAGKWKKWGKS